jgi:thiazole/oxazole-forming peptide maturase SagD family component
MMMPYKTQQLIQSMLSPLCGLIQEIGYMSRTYQSDTKLMIGAGVLTGVHVLQHQENPGRGAYHIGGSGFLARESMIRILGETVERYAQLMCEFNSQLHLKQGSYNEMAAHEEKIISYEDLQLYSTSQFNSENFLFSPPSKDAQLTWVQMHSCFDHTPIWIPAQYVLVGYQVKATHNEPWLTAAVTTGTATHTQTALALRSAILELVQLDNVMGHWYTAYHAYEIIADQRLHALTNLIKRYEARTQHTFKFYFIPSPDLIGFTIACLYLQKNGLPKVAIGLGSDLNLEAAMYKAFLEAAATVSLARMVVLKGDYGLDKHQGAIDPKRIYDLDRNVEYYANGHNFNRIVERFLAMPSIVASDLPSDINVDVNAQIARLVDAFKTTNKSLYYLNLSNVEAEALGFKVARVWSPNVLSLCLPSAVPALHPRFNAFGGLKHEDAHPYP